MEYKVVPCGRSKIFVRLIILIIQNDMALIISFIFDGCLYFPKANSTVFDDVTRDYLLTTIYAEFKQLQLRLGKVNISICI